MTRQKIHILDTLRGIVAFFIAFHHFTNAENHYGRLIDKNNQIISTIDPFLVGSVSVFFIISAYVIYLHLERHEYSVSTFLIFLLKRIIRILIPVLACIVMILVINQSFNYYQGNPITFNLSQFLANISLSAEFVGEDWYNPILWTLAIEFQLYLGLALVYPLLKKFPLISLAVFAIAMIPINVYFNTLGTGFYYGGYFCIGIAIYFYHQKRISLIATVIICSLSLIHIVWTHEWLFPVIPIISIPILLFVQKRFRLFELSGELSYSFYLTHGIFGGWLIYFVARYADTVLYQVILIFAALVISYAGSYVFYLLVEKPTQQLSRKIRYKK